MSLSTTAIAASVVVSGSPVALKIVDGTLTIDESWAPFIQVDLEVVDMTAATYAALDPRLTPAPVVTLTVSETAGTWNSFTRVATQFSGDGLLVRERSIDNRTGRVSLALASFEAAAQEMVIRPLADDAYVPIGAWDYATIVDNALDYAGLGPTVYADPSTVIVTTTEIFIGAGQTIWEVLEPYLQTNGLRLFADEAGDFRLVKSPYDLPDSDGVVLVGADPAYNLVEDEVTVSLDSGDESQQWFDAVWIEYTKSRDVDPTWNDWAGLGFGIYDGRRWLRLSYDTTYPGAGAAAYILARRQKLGLTEKAKAVSNYAARPGMHLAIQSPTDSTWRAARIVSVSHDLSAGTMSLNLRDLVSSHAHAWILIPNGRRWQDIAVGVPWTTAF